MSSTNILKSHLINTPLGEMIAVADASQLYFLEFADGRGLERGAERLSSKLGVTVVAGVTVPILSIELELKRYFEGKLKEFKTPYCFNGSPFQKSVWQALLKIPYGETRSYAQVAQLLGKPTAFRAVANANGANLLTIIIPCHRVINTGGGIGGYGGGIERKKTLLSLEKSFNKAF